MYPSGAASDHCLVDHASEEAAEFSQRYPIPRMKKPLMALRYSFLNLDRRMHFTGFRGALWRAMGVVRSSKNPNICNI